MRGTASINTTTMFIDLGCDSTLCGSTATFTGPSWSNCESQARKTGWRIHAYGRSAYCPECSALRGEEGQANQAKATRLEPA